MAVWIPVHQTLRSHPKTKRLARKLGVSQPTAIGHLVSLWLWAIDYAEDGDLSRHDSGDIADAMDWAGDAEQLLGALTHAGFVDADQRLHDWAEYGGRYIEKRDQNRERQSRKRARDKSATTAAGNAPVTRDSAVTHGTSRVSHSLREEESREDAMREEKMREKKSRGDLTRSYATPAEAMSPDARAGEESGRQKQGSSEAPASFFSHSENGALATEDEGEIPEEPPFGDEGTRETPPDSAPPPAAELPEAEQPYWTDSEEGQHRLVQFDDIDRRLHTEPGGRERAMQAYREVIGTGLDRSIHGDRVDSLIAEMIGSIEATFYSDFGDWILEEGVQFFPVYTWQ